MEIAEIKIEIIFLKSIIIIKIVDIKFECESKNPHFQLQNSCEISPFF